MRQRLAWMIALCAVLLMVAAPATVQAQVGDTAVVGGPGGGQDRDVCPEGWFLTGMSYDADKDINLVMPVCQRFVEGRATGDARWLGTWGERPDFIATSGTILCPPNTAAEAIIVGVSKVNLVHDFRFRCRNPNDHNYTDSSVSVVQNGQRGRQDTAGCGGGAMAIGILVHHGSLIDALGLVCRTTALAPPPPPVKPIKTTGRARVPSPPPAVPTGLPLAVRQTVTGSWTVTLGNGHRYLFQLTAQNQGISPLGRDDLPISISGTIYSASGETGGFGGSMREDRQVIVQYGFKGGASGTCALFYATDGKQLAGTCSEGGTSGPANGSRATSAEIAAAQEAATAPSAAAASARQSEAAAAAQGPAIPAADARAEAAQRAQGADVAAQVAGGPDAQGAAQGRLAGRVSANAAIAVTVSRSVDLYAAAGGDGDAIGTLEAGTAGVTLVEPCREVWCHVQWPGHSGWVYNGDDYRSLSF